MNAARTFKLLLLAVATLFLSAGAWLAQSGLKQLAFERRQIAQEQQSLENARRLMPEVQRREQLMHSLRDLEAQVDRLGFDPAQWGERRLRRSPGPATRVEASQFLAELERNVTGSIFVADVFDLATVSEDAGLFLPPQVSDKGLTLSASGTLYFQTRVAAPPLRTLP